jgi:hypothetical protein
MMARPIEMEKLQTEHFSLYHHSAEPIHQGQAICNLRCVQLLLPMDSAVTKASRQRAKHRINNANQNGATFLSTALAGVFRHETVLQSGCIQTVYAM